MVYTTTTHDKGTVAVLLHGYCNVTHRSTFDDSTRNEWLSQLAQPLRDEHNMLWKPDETQATKRTQYLVDFHAQILPVWGMLISVPHLIDNSGSAYIFQQDTIIGYGQEQYSKDYEFSGMPTQTSANMNVRCAAIQFYAQNLKGLELHHVPGCTGRVNQHEPVCHLSLLSASNPARYV